ncbi:MAG: TetR/AcrR family transcriptional regulator [Lachnospiraceae bacterium]|nr:TetR/AcrR family transcriptional regulator [Lachnospiraceae bacterium]MBO7599901.1 TetR/AcrR family transcriptional regulator [Lachnospiraceae bacterium]
MRVVKEAEERKNEILDAAEELFVTKGYDGTSTGDILDKVGIARGTLYYHFKSKEDILDALTERIGNAMFASAKRVADDKKIPVLERIIKCVACLKPRSDIGNEVIKQVHKPQNALMHQKMEKSILSGVIPIIGGLIEEGVSEGIFTTKYPLYAAEMLVSYSQTAFDDNFEQTEEETMLRIKAFIYHTEKILGVAEGSLEDKMIGMFS